jgi:hypothetical protein
MSSFRQLFTPRREYLEGSFQETPFDAWLRFNIQSALRQAEPSPRAWEQIKGQLANKDSTSTSYLSRFAIPIWSRHIPLILRILFDEPDLAVRLDERKMQLLTKMMTMPGPGAIRLAVT